jgi:hypothetical protein
MPACGVPTNCAANVQQSQQEIQAVFSGSGTAAPIYPAETAAGIIVAAPAALSVSGLDLSAMTAGRVLTASGIGATAGAGFDAMGQAIGGQPYRPGQTVVSALTGAAAGPLATESVIWNALLGGTVNTSNTAASNVLYGDSNSLYGAFAVGAIAASAGTGLGKVTENRLSTVLPKYIGASPIIPGVPLLLQNFGHANPYPSAVGEIVNQTVSGTTPIVIDHVSSKNGAAP